jgi:hypothetical protein
MHAHDISNLEPWEGSRPPAKSFGEQSSPTLTRSALLLAMISVVALLPVEAFAAGATTSDTRSSGAQPAPTRLAQATPAEATPSPVLTQTPESAPAAAPARAIGAHVGVATPLVTVSKSTTTIGDQFTVLNPIGLGFKLTEQLAIDFEFVIGTPVHPMTGTTSIVVDPGLVYNWGSFATGLRVAWAVQQSANIGLIPLLNVPIVHAGPVTWFVEAAFPTFLRHVDAANTTDGKLAFNAVLHTGVGF